MVKSELTEQLNALKALTRFELEETSVEFPDAKYLYIPQKAFLEKCYIPVENENEIINACFHVNELTCIVGPRGCGKTTTLIKILIKDCPSEFSYIRIDFSKESNLIRHLKKEEPSNFENELRKRINSLLRNKFYDGKNIGYLSDLSIELLKKPPGNYDYRNVYEDYIDERQDAMFAYIDSGQNVPYDEWLQNREDPVVNNLVNSVMKKVGIKQLIWGLLKFDRCKKFMMIFDNVDRIPNFFQPYYLSVANDIQNDIGTFSKCVVAIREENIKRPKENSDYQADFIELVYLREKRSIPIKNKKEVNMPLVRDDFTNSIIQNRLNFAKKIDLENIRKLSKKETKENWKLIRRITYQITKTYFREKLSKIANCSIRIVLDVYYDFLEYILSRGREEILTALDSPMCSRIFESYFYSWLIQNGGKLDLYLYNLVRLYYKWKESGELGCFPEHLVLTYLYNKKKIIEKSGRRYHFTKVGEVYEELLVLGFSPDEIKKAILDLYYVDPVFGQMIDMRNFKETSKVTVSSIDMDDQVWILPRGEICCSDTTHKYTYFIENIYRHHHPHKNVDLIEILESHIGEDVKFLCKIARMHLEGLVKIKNNLYQEYGDQWLKKYKEKFCIGGHLQLNRIIYNHYQYLKKFHKTDELKALRKLRKNFNKEVKRISLFGVFNDNICDNIFEKEFVYKNGIETEKSEIV